MQQIGKYEILGVLGHGGMGIVYKGHDPVIGREVAIKVIHQRAVNTEEGRRRFYREARSAGRLSHDNITVIHDVAEHEGRPFLVMEYLAGYDLGVVLNAGDKVPIVEKLKMATQICRGLEYAHEREIVHRDIKPDNVRILHDGRIKILDFGIARIQDESSTLTLTAAGTNLGTPRYMSPEQVKGEKLDRRSDIFSFGVVLYELLTGIPPFDGDRITTIIHNILYVEPESIDIDPKLFSDDLQQIIFKCLAKETNKRYQDFDSVLRDLQPLLNDRIRESGEMDPQSLDQILRETDDRTRIPEPKQPVDQARVDSDVLTRTYFPGDPQIRYDDTIRDTSLSDFRGEDSRSPGPRQQSPSSKGRLVLTGLITLAILATVAYLAFVPKKEDPNNESISVTEFEISKNLPGQFDWIPPEMVGIEGTLDRSSVRMRQEPENGSANIDRAAGLFTYTPLTDFLGKDTLRYTIDTQDGSTRYTIVLPITVNETEAGRPVANDDTSRTDEDSRVTIPVLDNDVGSGERQDSELLTVTIASIPRHGAAEVLPDMQIRYAPSRNYNGSDSFRYEVTNASGLTDQATVSVQVRPINDASVFRSSPPVAAEIGVPYRYDIQTEDVDGDNRSIGAPEKPEWLSLVDNQDGTAVLAGTPSQVDVGENRVRLSVFDGVRTTEQPFRIDVLGSSEGVLQATIPTSPENGARDIDLQPQLEWNSVPGASLFHLQLSNQAVFSDFILNDSTLTTIYYVVPELNTGTQFFWRVRPGNSMGYGPWSNTFSFTTQLPIADYVRRRVDELMQGLQSAFEGQSEEGLRRVHDDYADQYGRMFPVDDYTISAPVAFTDIQADRSSATVQVTIIINYSETIPAITDKRLWTLEISDDRWELVSTERL